jgi:formylglycine-generating enzyme required for sulfatase activity
MQKNHFFNHLPRLTLPVLAALVSLSPLPLLAAPNITIETVPVGDPNNPGDPTTGEGYGAVSYSFEIGKYDVTLNQYTAFLNAVATNPNANPTITALWIKEMADPTEDTGALIARTTNATTGAYSYSVVNNSTWKANSGNRPVCWVSWFDAARFANWMHNGATNGADTENGAYTLVNYQTDGFVARNPNALWWIPSENEWYKAAYYDHTKGKDLPTTDRYNNFATHTDVLPQDSANNPVFGAANAANYNWVRRSLRKSANPAVQAPGVLTPVGYYAKSKSAYGTYDQAGLVWQWTEGVVSNTTQTNRVVRGGSWGPGITPISCYIRRDYPPGFYEDDDTGFRLARTPR